MKLKNTLILSILLTRIAVGATYTPTSSEISNFNSSPGAFSSWMNSTLSHILTNDGGRGKILLPAGSFTAINKIGLPTQYSNDYVNITIEGDPNLGTVINSKSGTGLLDFEFQAPASEIPDQNCDSDISDNGARHPDFARSNVTLRYLKLKAVANQYGWMTSRGTAIRIRYNPEPIATKVNQGPLIDHVIIESGSTVHFQTGIELYNCWNTRIRDCELIGKTSDYVGAAILQSNRGINTKVARCIIRNWDRAISLDVDPDTVGYCLGGSYVEFAEWNEGFGVYDCRIEDVRNGYIAIAERYSDGKNLHDVDHDFEVDGLAQHWLSFNNNLVQTTGTASGLDGIGFWANRLLAGIVYGNRFEVSNGYAVITKDFNGIYSNNTFTNNSSGTENWGVVLWSTLSQPDLQPDPRFTLWNWDWVDNEAELNQFRNQMRLFGNIVHGNYFENISNSSHGIWIQRSGHDNLVIDNEHNNIANPSTGHDISEGNRIINFVNVGN